MTILTRGADRLLELHAAELPQKDELCGCFWATLALRLHGEESVEQDDVALLAGSAITSHGHQHVLPLGQAGRRRGAVVSQHAHQADPDRVGQAAQGAGVGGDRVLVAGEGALRRSGLEVLGWVRVAHQKSSCFSSCSSCLRG